MKPSPKHDWTRAIQIKLACIIALLSELPVDLVADDALTSARKVEKAADKLYGFALWLSYGLFIVTVVLGLVAAVTGIKRLGGVE